MFEHVTAVDSLREITARDRASDPLHESGASRIEAIKAFERVICAAPAGQLSQIAALRGERRALMPLGAGDPALSVIGEVAMARNISPGAAGTQFGLFREGVIGEAVVRAD